MHLNRINNSCKRANRYDPQTNSRVLATCSGTDASDQPLQTNFEAHTPAGLAYNSAGDLSQITDPCSTKPA